MLHFPPHPKRISFVSRIMIWWMIALLTCIGYFLNEARRAPVIEEDDTSDGVEVKTGNASTLPCSSPKVTEQD
jgi:hypothetical protein